MYVDKMRENYSLNIPHKVNTVKSLISALSLISAPPSFFMITNYKELKEKFQIFKETKAKNYKKWQTFDFIFKSAWGAY